MSTILSLASMEERSKWSACELTAAIAFFDVERASAEGERERADARVASREFSADIDYHICTGRVDCAGAAEGAAIVDSVGAGAGDGSPVDMGAVHE